MQAIDWIYDEEFEIAFKNIGKELWEDLRQEVALIVLEYDEVKLNELVGKGKQVFKFWIVRICCNQTNSKFGKFGRLYKSIVPVEDVVKFIKEDDVEVDNQHIVDGVMKAIDKLYWYDAEVLKWYIKLGSVRKVSAYIGIPHTSIFMTIKNIRKCIKGSLDY